MRIIKLNVKKEHLFNKGQTFFYDRDIDGSIKSCTPGEWIQVEVGTRKVLGFANPNVTDGSDITILDSTEVEPRAYIENKLIIALNKRKLFGYKGCARLVYGQSDQLPGLVIDGYSNLVIIQVNNAGMDIHRELIKAIVKEQTKKECYFLDNEKYRKREGLPIFEKDLLPETIEVKESNFNYSITREQLQKIGYYYDHRENRQKLERTLESLDREFTNGLDLFCYIGSWGMHCLRANVTKMTFVDQANMQDIVSGNMSLNKFPASRGAYIRSDVFKFLDAEVTKGSIYDVIVCDPPAFNKSANMKGNSLVGYEKLYQRIFKIIAKNGILAAASCTQNISLEELDAAVGKVARKLNRKVQLIDLGIQGHDHPVHSLKSKSNYIKYLCYIVE